MIGWPKFMANRSRQLASSTSFALVALIAGLIAANWSFAIAWFRREPSLY